MEGMTISERAPSGAAWRVIVRDLQPLLMQFERTWAPLWNEDLGSDANAVGAAVAPLEDSMIVRKSRNQIASSIASRTSWTLEISVRSFDSSSLTDASSLALCRLLRRDECAAVALIIV